MKIAAMVIMGLIMLTGCAATPARNSQVPTVAAAKAELNDGEFYEARRMTEKILAREPENKEAQLLMASIIDQEISRQKEAFETTAPEEFTKDQKSQEIKTWLERGRALLDAGEFDEAMLATERVFLYDADNADASALLDDIRDRAVSEGKAQMLVEKQVLRGEMDERVARYHEQIEEWKKEGRWGAVKLAVDKILLLSPEDEKALALREQISKQKKAA